MNSAKGKLQTSSGHANHTTIKKMQTLLISRQKQSEPQNNKKISEGTVNRFIFARDHER